MGKKPKTMKCFWCSKMVLVCKGRISSHVVSRKIQCVGIGFPAGRGDGINQGSSNFSKIIIKRHNCGN